MIPVQLGVSLVIVAGNRTWDTDLSIWCFDSITF